VPPQEKGGPECEGRIKANRARFGAHITACARTTTLHPFQPRFAPSFFLSHSPPPPTTTTTHTHTPQIWPYIYNLNKWEWTDLTSAKCASPGCNATAPLPGDKLTVVVAVFVDKPKLPPILFPLTKVAEVITDRTCAGLPGKCQPVDADYCQITGGRKPVYRIEWGPYYGIFGVQHFYDLLDYGEGGTTFYHHEYYTGLAGVLFGEALMVPLVTPWVEAVNADMLAFATDNLMG